VSSNGCVTKPREHAIGLAGCAVSIRSSSLTGSYVMETAEHREPYESRGSRTVLGAPGGETPPGEPTIAPDGGAATHRGMSAMPPIATRLVRHGEPTRTFVQPGGLCSASSDHRDFPPGSYLAGTVQTCERTQYEITLAQSS